jgi:hypothetical protein
LGEADKHDIAELIEGQATFRILSHLALVSAEAPSRPPPDDMASPPVPKAVVHMPVFDDMPLPEAG